MDEARFALGDTVERGEIAEPFAILLFIDFLFKSTQRKNFSIEAWNIHADSPNLSPMGSVKVPLHMLSVISSSMDCYLDQKGATLDVAFGAVRGRGHRSGRDAFIDLYDQFIIARLVFEEHLLAQRAGLPISDRQAFSNVSDNLHPDRTIAVNTIRDAWSRWGNFIIRVAKAAVE